MARLIFKGGPWDGVEFEAPFPPDEISMKWCRMMGEPGDRPGSIRIRHEKRDHHVYKAVPGDWSEYPIEYEYQPAGTDAKPT